MMVASMFFIFVIVCIMIANVYVLFYFMYHGS